jgi:NADH-ubiquinone oxidoreductase chain 6
MLIILLTISISLVFIIPTLHTPLFLGSSILIYSFLISAITTIITSSWFGFILFIIYIGGILVIFAYFAALSPNQIHYTPTLFIILPVSTLLFYFILLNSQSNYFSPPLIHIYRTKINSLLYSQEQAPVLIFLVILLLLALIIVVKITKHTTGPLRPFQ